MSVFLRCSVCLVIAVTAGSIPAFAQSREERVDNRIELSALLTEVRQLRLAIEEMARSHARSQAIIAMASVQQGRVAQVNGRLESARRERESASERSRAIAAELEAIDSEGRQALDSVRRQQLDVAIRRLTQAQSAEFEREQDSRRREEELTHTLGHEESRWADVLNRLEQLMTP